MQNNNTLEGAQGKDGYKAACNFLDMKLGERAKYLNNQIGIKEAAELLEQYAASQAGYSLDRVKEIAQDYYYWRDERRKELLKNPTMSYDVRVATFLTTPEGKSLLADPIPSTNTQNRNNG